MTLHCPITGALTDRSRIISPVENAFGKLSLKIDKLNVEDPEKACISMVNFEPTNADATSKPSPYGSICV
jgi:hypothetical protein